MRRVLILAVLTTVIISVRLKHLADQTYNLTMELEKVTSQQKRFEQQFLALSREVENINKQLTTSTNSDQRINVLQTSMLQWRQDVFDLSKTIIPAFNFSKCSCQGMTIEQKNRIINDIYTLKKSVQQLKTSAELMERCDKVNQVISDATKQLFFLDSMNDILTANCQKSINIGPTIFQTNLYADNWILGNYTIDDIVTIYTQRFTQYNNITNCPLSRPFYDGRSCIKCPQQSPVFNIQTSKCGNCQPNEYLDNIQKRCVVNSTLSNNTFNSNPQTGGLIAPTGYTPDSTYQTCPIQRPYFNGSQCISCTYPNNLFNLTSKSCVSCPTGKIYNSQKKDCEDKPSSWKEYNTNPVAKNIISNSSFEKNSNFQDCPLDRPYFNGIQCISCDSPNNLFNYTSKTCTSCPTGTYYAQNQHQCKSINSSNETAKTSDNGQYNTDPSAPRILSKEKIIRNPQLPNCPIERPYFDGHNCIVCEGINNLFNYDTKQCTSCPTGEVYSQDSLSCERASNTNTTQTNNTNSTGNPFMVSNLSNKNWIINDDNSGRVYEQISKNLTQPNARKCPEGHQFWNGSECIGCSTGQYFSFDTKSCVKCPDDQIFSLNMHRCVKAQNATEYQTNPVNTSNLIYDGTAGIEYQNTYKLNKEKYPNIKDCPPQRPFFDGLSCIACKPPFPYFNLNQKVCQQCPNDTNYNPNNHQCETIEGKIIYQGPTLEKMLAGIF